MRQRDEYDVATVHQLAADIFKRHEATYSASRECAAAELVERIEQGGLTQAALWECAAGLLDACKRTANIAPFRRSLQREAERVEASVASLVTGDSRGTGLPVRCYVAEYRELLTVRLWNHKRVRNATRDELLEHCTRLEAQAETNQRRARRLRELAGLMMPGETALTSIRRIEQDTQEEQPWSKSSSMAS